MTKTARITARFALLLSAIFSIAYPAQARFWQCAPYAREISGIAIHGNANTWWGQAAGKYARGNAPKAGAVLAFKATSRMRVGHVAMVSQVVSDREVKLTHANWSQRGGIERDVRAVDVSAAGDWSEVKVWYRGAMGQSEYPTFGFIYGGKPGDVTDAPVVMAKADAPAKPVQIASLNTSFGQ